MQRTQFRVHTAAKRYVRIVPQKLKKIMGKESNLIVQKFRTYCVGSVMLLASRNYITDAPVKIILGYISSHNFVSPSPEAETLRKGSKRF